MLSTTIAYAATIAVCKDPIHTETHRTKDEFSRIERYDGMTSEWTKVKIVSRASFTLNLYAYLSTCVDSRNSVSESNNLS